MLSCSESFQPHVLSAVDHSESVGAPAGGMNAATRTAVRYCIARGHTPLGVLNGFKGLIHDGVQEMSWLRVDSWMTRGGSELGTNRATLEDNLGLVASKFQKHGFDGVFLIGGFEAFSALLALEKSRKLYIPFQIPLVHLPATISNNVPVTEFSIGSDTSLNALVDACDAIKQSASASRNRVFVVETQGGMCGYLATMGGLAVSIFDKMLIKGINYIVVWSRYHLYARRRSELGYASKGPQVPEEALRI